MSELFPGLNEEEKFKKLLNETMQTLISVNRSSFMDIFGHIWANAGGLSPQQCFDIFGQSGASFLQIAGLMVQIFGILQVDFNLNPPTGFSIQPNQDGTITVVQS